MLATVKIPIICRRLLRAPSLLCFWIMFTSPTLALDKEALRRAITGPDRDVTDFVRDQVRKPVEVLDFLGIEAGMTVLDLYAAGGYYTFILSKVVGPEGIVYAQNQRGAYASRKIARTLARERRWTTRYARAISATCDR